MERIKLIDKSFLSVSRMQEHASREFLHFLGIFLVQKSKEPLQPVTDQHLDRYWYQTFLRFCDIFDLQSVLRENQ